MAESCPPTADFAPIAINPLSGSWNRNPENPQPLKSSPARPKSAPTQRPTSAPPSPYLLPSAYKCGSPASLPNYTAEVCEPGERNPSNYCKNSTSYFHSGLSGSKRLISAFAFAIWAGVAEGIPDHLCQTSNESGYNFDASLRICIARSSSLFSAIICAV